MSAPATFSSNGVTGIFAVIVVACAVYAGYVYSRDSSTAKLRSLCLWLMGVIYAIAFYINFSIASSTVNKA